MVYLSTDHTYIISFKKKFPIKKGRRPKLPLVAMGVDKSTTMILGICLPLGSVFTIRNNRKVDSFEELRNTENGDSYYHDTTSGIAFLKLKGTYTRQLGETHPCGEGRAACLEKVRVKSH